jgi:hypothetical protein
MRKILERNDEEEKYGKIITKKKYLNVYIFLSYFFPHPNGNMKI